MNKPHPTWSDSPIHEQIRAMNDTPTPETDKHEFPCMTWPSQDHPMVVRADFARKLERERDEAREETIRTREFMDHGFRVAQEELTAVTEQRDEARETLAELRASVLDLSHPNIKMILSERDRLQKIVDEQCRVSSVCREYQEQRDRLMFSIKKIYNISLFDYNTMPEAARRLYHGVVLEIADKARKHLSSNTI